MEEAFNYTSLLCYAFAPNDMQPVINLFGVKNEKLVRLTFTLDEVEMGMIESNLQISMSSFNGTKLRIKVTDELVIVSNADGLNPGIYFFNYNLE